MGPADLPNGAIMLSYFRQEIRLVIVNFKNFDRFVTKIFSIFSPEIYGVLWAYLDAVASRVP